jgi:predicted transcriptional regulator
MPLAVLSPKPDTLIMTQKELVLDAISELPDEASLDEIARRIEFLAAIQKGIDQLDRGEGIPHEEVKRQLATWLAR